MPALKRKRKEPSLDLITNMDSDTMLEMMSFLNHTDRRELSQTCKRMREVIVDNGLLEYHLNEESSSKYYTENKSSHRLRKRLSTFNGGGVITKIQLHGRRHVVNLKCLQGVKHIILHYCHDIVNLDPIFTSHTIDINYCPKIKNIGMLGNVNTLSFDGQNNVSLTGFSLLNNIENLSLSDCSTLRNEDMINWNPRKLVLDTCKLITELPRFSNIYHVELYSININDLSPLANVHTLVLSDCKEATNFSALCGVMDLSIESCDTLAIEDLPFLSNVPKLSLITSNNLASGIPSLTNQDLTVEFNYCDTLTSV